MTPLNQSCRIAFAAPEVGRKVQLVFQNHHFSHSKD
jgi:hypothetical protein